MSDAARIEELEVKVAFQEKLLHDLDEVVRALRDQHEALQQVVGSLTEEVARGRPSEASDPVDEVPPHY